MLRRTIGEDIELITEPASDLGHVKADEGQLEQVILNLAVNARDAMPEGGKLIIRTENTVVTEAETMQYSYAFTPGRYVLMTVTDTGVGMDAGIKGRIFEPFFTTKERGKGTGLGLSTVFGVVKQSNGYIEVHSEVDRGATFRVYLPLVEEPVAVQRPSAPVQPCEGGLTILLAEDETKLRVLTKSMLERLGFTVLEAGNGKEACELARRHVGAIDLLLTDVVMPGMNGCQLAEALGPEFPEMKILYTSGYTGQGLGQEIIPAGSHFLRKPFSRESLGVKIQEVLETESAEVNLVDSVAVEKSEEVAL
jgi:CheY-like chemotaxis protein